MPRLPATPRADRPVRAHGAWRVTVVVALVLSLVAAPGCSSKPARKKGKSKASAARQREERPLIEPADAAAPTADAAATVAGDDTAAGSGTPSAAVEADAVPAAAEPPATNRADAEPSSAVPPAEPAPPETAATMPALDAPAPTGPRPRSALVDPDTAIPVDGGRVEVSSPLGWTRSPRSQNYLVRYQPGPRKTFPSIVVTVEPAPEGLGEVTTKNQAELVAAVTAKLAVDFPAGGPVKVIKKPQAVTLGEHAGVAWAVPGSVKIDGLTETIDRFAWGVVLGGRLYVVEARGPRAKIDDDAKARAKAVASTLFRPEGAPGAPESGATATE